MLLSVLGLWLCCCWFVVYCHSNLGGLWLFCVWCTLLYAHSSFAIILVGKRELVALLSLSSWCLVVVVWLFLAVPYILSAFCDMVFPDHTHLLFFSYWRYNFIKKFCEVNDTNSLV